MVSQHYSRVAADEVDFKFQSDRSIGLCALFLKLLVEGITQPGCSFDMPKVRPVFDNCVRVGEFMHTMLGLG